MIANVFHIFDLEFLLGAMQKNPQVFPFYAELLANLITITLVEKDRLQQRTVPLR